ncbi:e3 herc2 ubiquitin-protein ligase, partial [Mytilus galloprovincialis]
MQCDETSTYNLRKVDEPRILVDEMIAVGCRVVRGHDWKFGNKDGGVGSLGTVLDVRPEGKAVVRWDSKRTGLYKMGHNGRFEIKVHGAPVRSRSKMNEHQSEYKSPHTSDSESEPESFRPRFRPTRDNATQEPNDYVIPIYSDATVSAIWEYEEGSEWRQYPNDINVKIEKAYQRKKTGKTIIEMDRTTGTKDTKGTVKLINLKQTDNAMAKNEKDKQKNNSTHDTT